MDAEQFRNGEVQNSLNFVGRHKAIYDPIKERNETTASSSNRTFNLLTERLYGKITEKATESTTTISIPVTDTTANSEERSETTTSSSNRSFFSLCFNLLTEWLFGKTTTTGSVQGES